MWGRDLVGFSGTLKQGMHQISMGVRHQFHQMLTYIFAQINLKFYSRSPQKFPGRRSSQLNPVVPGQCRSRRADVQEDIL